MTTCRTLGDVRAFILKQPEHIQERGSWQHAAELMILAAERGGNIEAATTQIEDALFLEARYVRQSISFCPPGSAAALQSSTLSTSN